MSIISTLFSWGKTALGAAVPGAGIAFKVAPWAISGVLALGLVVEHYRLVAAESEVKTAQARLVAAGSEVKTAQAQTAEAVKQCQAEAASQAAADNAAVLAQKQKADAAASVAEVQLFHQRRAAQTITGQVQQALGQQLGSIAVQANQAGQDGPVPPVLAEMFP